jgi:threonine dehydratase
VRQSLARGERVRIDVPRTIADGLQTPEPGELTFEVLRHRVDGIVTVTDEQLVDAMRFSFERLKLVIEPSGAAGIAALLAGALEPGALAPGARVGVVVSGGNVGADRFAELLGR